MSSFIVFLLMFLFTASHAYFNCNRDTTLCQGGSSCNKDTGVCNCPAGRSGYDCSVVNANVDQNGCILSNPCQNGGTCHMASGAAGPSCHCPEDFIGDNCESLRANVLCENNGMNLTVKPFVSTFSGIIFEIGFEFEPACAAQEIGNGVQSAWILNDESTCAPFTTNERCFYVLYNAKTLTSLDQKLCASCGGSTVQKTTGSVTVTGIDSNIESKTVGESPTQDDVGFELLHDGVPVISSVVLGTDLELFAYLTESGAERFKAIRLQDCTANNDPDTPHLNVSLVENNCLSDEMSSVVNAPNRTDDNRNVTLTFGAFSFLHGDTVTIDCTIKTCILSADCDPTECSTGEDPKTGLGRRKRQVEPDSEERTVKVKYTHVQLGSNKNVPEIVLTPEVPTCSASKDMIPIVVSLGVALMVVLILTIVLTVKIITDRKAVKKMPGPSLPPNSNLPTIVSDKWNRIGN